MTSSTRPCSALRVETLEDRCLPSIPAPADLAGAFDHIQLKLSSATATHSATTSLATETASALIHNWVTNDPAWNSGQAKELSPPNGGILAAISRAIGSYDPPLASADRPLRGADLYALIRGLTPEEIDQKLEFLRTIFPLPWAVPVDAPTTASLPAHPVAHLPHMERQVSDQSALPIPVEPHGGSPGIGSSPYRPPAGMSGVSEWPSLSAIEVDREPPQPAADSRPAATPTVSGSLPEAPAPKTPSALAVLYSELLGGIPLAAELPLDIPTIESQAREFLEHLSALGPDLPGEVGWREYLWFAAGVLIAGGVTHTLLVSRNRERGRKTQGSDPADWVGGGA